MRSASSSIISLRRVARHALVITGVVGGGEGVLLAADTVATVLEKSPTRVLFGALEHQVFEEVGEARFAGRLVGGTDPIPHHVGRQAARAGRGSPPPAGRWRV